MHKNTSKRVLAGMASEGKGGRKHDRCRLLHFLAHMARIAGIFRRNVCDALCWFRFPRFPLSGPGAWPKWAVRPAGQPVPTCVFGHSLQPDPRAFQFWQKKMQKVKEQAQTFGKENCSLSQTINRQLKKDLQKCAELARDLVSFSVSTFRP